MNFAVRHKMSVAEFLRWADAKSDGDYELIDGQVVAMVQERARHNLAKIEVVRSLQDGVRAAGLSCTVYTDGMTVKVDEHTARGPDAILQCGEPIEYDSMLVKNPLVVVEVVSPSSERRDTDAKLIDYFSIESITHYLIFFPHKGVAVHHARGGPGEIETRLIYSGTITLDPPGMSLQIESILAVGRE